MDVIYDDIIKDLQSSGGISVYWDNLKNQLVNKFNVSSFNGKNNKRDLNLTLSFHRYLNFKTNVNYNHIFHSSYYRISKNRNSKNVVTVHDFVYEYYSTGLKKYFHLFQKRNALLYADRIICVSENTKKDLLKFYPKLERKIIKVIYHGVSDDFYMINHNSTKKIQTSKSLVFIGNRRGYKNFQIVLDILFTSKKYNLIIVGGGLLSKKEKSKLKNISIFII